MLCFIVWTAQLVIATTRQPQIIRSHWNIDVHWDLQNHRPIKWHSIAAAWTFFFYISVFYSRVFTQKRWTAQSRNTGNPGRLLSSSNSSWLMGWMCPWAAVLFGGACFSQSRPAVVLLAAAAAAAAQAASSSYASRQPRSGLSALMFCERWEYWFLVSRIIISRD